MKEFLMGLYIEHGDRDFGFDRVRKHGGMVVSIGGKARNEGFIELIYRPKYDDNNLPYKLTPKAIEFIKAANE